MSPRAYHLLETLGRGGMGEVYLAVHTGSGQRVAIKTIRPELAQNPTYRRQILNEAAAAALLQHPHIVSLLDVGRDDAGTPFLVMELVQAQDLREWTASW